MRYLRFKDITFGEVPKSEWHKYFRELVEVEHSLVWGSSIGDCWEFPFKFHVEDPTPIKAKPMPLAKGPREWVR